MKFTIESFKTHVYRPAEWMINNEKIFHLIGDLTKQFSLSLEEIHFSSCCDSAGETFSIKMIYNNCSPSAKKFKVSEIEILTVKFLNISSNDLVYDKVYFEDNFEKLINETNLPYWTAAALLKKINALVFKVLTDMQEYKELEICNKKDMSPIEEFNVRVENVFANLEDAEAE